jgi:hypothetical protein
MSRARRIFSRGWLDSALSVLTLGYYPFTAEIAAGLLCGTLEMAIPGGDVSLLSPGGFLALVSPGGTIEIEDCE